MRIFDFNYAFKSFNGTYTASSNTDTAKYCFDELIYTRWVSDGENSDLIDSYVERDFGSERDISNIFVKETNIKAPWIEYWDDDDSAWVSPTQSFCSAESLNHHLITLSTTLTFQKFRVYGNATIVADSEKLINEIYAFEAIGRMNIPPADINPKRIKEQEVHILDNGKKRITNTGRRWEIDVTLKAHIGQEDIDLIQYLVKRDMEFYLWLNDDNDAIMNQKFEPFSFDSLLKVGVEKGDNPGYYKNLHFSGMDNKIKLVEVS